MKNKFERLILLEFLVNKVELNENEFNIDKNFLSKLGELCVKIKFKSSFIVEISEDENSTTECSENGMKIINVRAGKSCLLSVGQLMESSDCEATICLSRKCLDDIHKEYFFFGQTKVNLAPIFKVLQGPCNKPPKEICGVYDIYDGQCTKIGTIELFVRGTGLGKNIVTMFQLGAGESSFYFKGTEQPSEGGSEDDEESSCTMCHSEFGPISQPKTLRPTPKAAPQQPCYPYKEGTTYTQQPPQSPWGLPAFQPGFQVGFPMVGPMGPMGGPIGPMGGGPMGPMGGPMGHMGGPMHPIGGGPMHPIGGPMQPMGGGPMHSMGGGPMGTMGGPMVPMGGPIDPMGGPGFPGQSPYGQPGEISQNLPPYRDEDYEKLEGNYKEISAEVNGYEVKIKLLRRPKKGAER